MFKKQNSFSLAGLLSRKPANASESKIFLSSLERVKAGLLQIPSFLNI